MQGQVVAPTPAEHRRLAAGLGVPRHLEEIELCVFPDLHEGECPLLPEMLYSQDLRLEHVPIELHEALGVVREHRHVVEAVGEHSTPPCRDDQAFTLSPLSPLSPSRRTVSRPLPS